MGPCLTGVLQLLAQGSAGHAGLWPRWPRRGIAPVQQPVGLRWARGRWSRFPSQNQPCAPSHGRVSAAQDTEDSAQPVPSMPAPDRARTASSYSAAASLAASIPVVGLVASPRSKGCESRTARAGPSPLEERPGSGHHGARLAGTVGGVRRPSRARLGYALAAAAGRDSDPTQAPGRPRPSGAGGGRGPGRRFAARVFQVPSVHVHTRQTLLSLAPRTLSRPWSRRATPAGSGPAAGTCACRVAADAQRRRRARARARDSDGAAAHAGGAEPRRREARCLAGVTAPLAGAVSLPQTHTHTHIRPRGRTWHGSGDGTRHRLSSSPRRHLRGEALALRCDGLGGGEAAPRRRNQPRAPSHGPVSAAQGSAQPVPSMHAPPPARRGASTMLRPSAAQRRRHVPRSIMRTCLQLTHGLFKRSNPCVRTPAGLPSMPGRCWRAGACARARWSLASRRSCSRRRFAFRVFPSLHPRAGHTASQSASGSGPGPRDLGFRPAAVVGQRRCAAARWSRSRSAGRFSPVNLKSEPASGRVRRHAAQRPNLKTVRGVAMAGTVTISEKSVSLECFSESESIGAAAQPDGAPSSFKLPVSQSADSRAVRRPAVPST